MELKLTILKEDLDEGHYFHHSKNPITKALVYAGHEHAYFTGFSIAGLPFTLSNSNLAALNKKVVDTIQDSRVNKKPVESKTFTFTLKHNKDERKST